MNRSQETSEEQLEIPRAETMINEIAVIEKLKTQLEDQEEYYRNKIDQFYHTNKVHVEIFRAEKMLYEFRMLRLQKENEKLRTELESYKANGKRGGPRGIIPPL